MIEFTSEVVYPSRFTRGYGSDIVAFAPCLRASTNSTTWADILYGGPGGIRTPEGEAKGFTVLPIWPLWYRPKYKNGATYQTWTDDRRFTKPMLYQLS